MSLGSLELFLVIFLGLPAIVIPLITLVLVSLIYRKIGQIEQGLK